MWMTITFLMWFMTHTILCRGCLCPKYQQQFQTSKSYENIHLFSSTLSLLLWLDGGTSLKLPLIVCVCVFDIQPYTWPTRAPFLEFITLSTHNQRLDLDSIFLSQSFPAKILKQVQRSLEGYTHMQACMINLNQVQIGQGHDTSGDLNPLPNACVCVCVCFPFFVLVDYAQQVSTTFIACHK